MDKKYQAFVSLSRAGMEAERREVAQALLELGCLPVGLGLLPAGRDGHWELVRRLIDESDYYAIVAGAPEAGSDLAALGAAEREYRHALETGKPVLAFLHAPGPALPMPEGAEPEGAEQVRRHLDGFRRLLGERAVRDYATPAELGSMVSRGFIQMIRLYPARGWVPADTTPAGVNAEEVLRLRSRIDALQAELGAARISPPPAAAGLAHGEDSFECRVNLETISETGEIEAWTLTCPVSWDEMFNALAPYLLEEANDLILRRALNVWLNRAASAEEDFHDVLQDEVRSFEILDDDYQTIKVQLRALGLIARTERTRSLKENAAWWRLTPFGEEEMNRLRAIRRQETP